MNAKSCFLAALFALGCNVARADESQCPAYVEPEIIITTTFPEQQYNNTVSAAGLKNIQLGEDAQNNNEDDRKRVADESLHIGGMTDFGEMSAPQNIELEFLKMPDGVICTKVSKFTLTMKLKRAVVYVANEFPVGSCSYSVIIEHELKHIAVAKDFLDRSPEVAKNYMQIFFRQLGVIQGKSIEENSAYISQAYKTYSGQFHKNLTSVLNKREGLVDTPQEYRRVYESCSGETKKIFDQIRH